MQADGNYYPFGLTMEGISAKAINKLEQNKYKYNGIEQIGDLGLEDYDAKFRELDPQIGRWWQVDPKIENMEMWSPYVSNYNNPIKFSDFFGDEPGPDDPLVLNGIFTGKHYSMTKPQSVRSALAFGVEYIGNALMEGVEAVNRNINPLVSAAEVLAGKSYESGFTEEKSRITAGVEVAASFIPAGRLEMNGAKAVERSLVSLDNSALNAAIKEGKKDIIKEMIGPDKPIISIAAAKEYLVAGSKMDLKKFMMEIGATISRKGASGAQVSGLQQAASGLKRALGYMDGMILGGAMNNNARVITGDNKFYKFMQAIGWPSSNYNK